MKLTYAACSFFIAANICITPSAALDWDNAIKKVEKNIEVMSNKGKMLNASWLGSSFINVDIEKHRCSILGRMVRRSSYIYHLEEPLPSAIDDGTEYIIASQSLSNWVRLARLFKKENSDVRIRLWNLHCVGKMNISASSRIEQVNPGEYAVSWQENSSLVDYVRRKAVVEGMINLAVQKKDASYLDRIPPEYISVQFEGMIAQARQQIESYNWQQRQRLHEMAERERQEIHRANQARINQRWAEGEPIDPREFADGDPQTYDYALRMQNTERFINEAESVANRNKVARAIQSAFTSGDFGKIAATSDGSKPTMAQLEKFILGKTNMRSADKRSLIENLENLILLD